VTSTPSAWPARMWPTPSGRRRHPTPTGGSVEVWQL
jgi:hypothetical protein